jgi:two-component system, cell cycle sensor histidine kinase and response regulator CckA
MMVDHSRGEPSGSSTTVLVVDDDAMMRNLIRRTLAAAGYEVWVAASVPEARQLLPAIEHHLGVILADVVMPGGLGPELAADVLTFRPHTRVAYISSYSEAKLRTHGVDLHGAPFLAKPFMPAQLLAFLADLVSPARRPRAAS